MTKAPADARARRKRYEKIEAYRLRVNRLIGQKMKARRVSVQMKLEALAERTGIPLQRLNEFEQGQGDITAFELWVIRRALWTSLPAFFEDIEDDDSILR